MSVLLVGAGAVGQCFGHCLQRAGAPVSFYVREKYADQAREGYAIYPLNRPAGQRWRPQEFEGFGVLTRPEEVARQRWDQVYLCIPSTGLQGPWLGPFLEAIGEATLVQLTPGLQDRALLSGWIAQQRIVTGMIGFIAFQAPLPRQQWSTKEGVAYWFPPLSPCLFSGQRAQVGRVMALLSRGDLPARAVGSVEEVASQATAVLMPFLCELERQGWSLEAMSNAQSAARVTAAARQATAVAARYNGHRAPLWRSLLGRAIIEVVVGAMRFGPWPFNMEVYFRYHFEKVGAQTRQFMREYCELAADQGQPSEALRVLIAGLEA